MNCRTDNAVPLETVSIHAGGGLHVFLSSWALKEM